MEGVDRDAVAAQLKKRGILPLTISQILPPSANEQSLLAFFERPKINDLLLFARQMATLSRSGVPLVRSFQGLIESSGNGGLKRAMVAILANLQAGRDLSASLAEHPKIFDKFFVRIIRVGEETGRLDEAFSQIFNYLENGKKTRQRIVSAVRYPIFVLFTVTLALAVVNYYVVPAFVELFTKFGAELPLSTQILLDISKFTHKYALTILVVFFLLFMGIKLSLTTTNGRLYWDRILLQPPLVGSLLQRISLARLARIFVLGSRSGMSMVQVLSAVEETVNNRFIAQRVALIKLGVTQGESLAQAARGSKIFTPLVVQMISVGEETGQVEQMMAEVAEFYEQEVDYEIQAISSTIEPLLLLFLAVIVLVLAMGIFLPLWDLGAGGLAGR